MKKQNPVGQFLSKIVPTKKLRSICEKYGIEAEEGATYKQLLDKAILKKAKEGNNDATEPVKEFNIHE